MNQSFLKTLANGKHTMTIVYEDGSVTTDFTISNSPTIEKNPKTTDFGTTTILLIVIGIIGFIVLYVTRSQKSIMINIE